MRSDQIFVLTDHRSGVAKGAEIFAGIETERRGIADRSDALSAPASAVRLGCVFDHFQIVLARDLHDRVHVARLAVKVDRDDGFRPRRDRRLDERRVH